MSQILKISTIITTRHRPLLLEKCLESLRVAIAQVSVQVEILVCVNGEDEESQRLVEAAAAVVPHFKILNLPRPVSPAAARNKMIPFVSADEPVNGFGHWLYFIDDDAFVDAEFFVRFLKAIGDHPDAAVFGGPNLTPENSSLFQRASGAALSSRFGAYFSSRRYASRSGLSRTCGEEALILCSLFVRRDALSSLRFPENFVCNEENWILQELQKQRHKMIYAPMLAVWHERRTRPASFAKQIHRYGIGRGQNLRYRPTSLHFAHLLPAACVVFTLLVLLLLPWSQWLVPAWLLLFSCYALFWTSATTRIGRATGEPRRVRLLGALLFPIIHVSYGTGVLRGLVAPGD